MLIIGFALGMWAGETLEPLIEDESQICIWKTWYHMLFAAVFFLCVALCISCGLVIVSFVLYIKQAAQKAALLVSTSAAVAKTREHLGMLYYVFVATYLTFTLSAVLLIILFVGLPARLPILLSSDAAESELESIVEQYDGSYTITCVDPRETGQNARRDLFGGVLCSMNTLVVASMAVAAYHRFRCVRRSYESAALLSWFVIYQTEQRAKHDAVQNLPAPTNAVRVDSRSEVDSTASSRPTDPAR